MAQWSKRSPFTSDVAGSILSENVNSCFETVADTRRWGGGGQGGLEPICVV